MRRDPPALQVQLDPQERKARPVRLARLVLIPPYQGRLGVPDRPVTLARLDLLVRQVRLAVRDRRGTMGQQDQQALRGPLGRLDQLVPLEQRVTQVRLEPQALKEQLGLPDQPEIRGVPEPPARQDQPDQREPIPRFQVPQDQLDLPEAQEQPERKGLPAVMGPQALRGQPDLLEQPGPQERLAIPAPQGQPEPRDLLGVRGQRAPLVRLVQLEQRV